MSIYTYDQLCGALGLLKQNDVELDYAVINEQMRDIGKRVGIAQYGDPITNTPATGHKDPVHVEVDVMLRQYRNICLKRGLIRRGELFNIYDHVPLT